MIRKNERKIREQEFLIRLVRPVYFSHSRCGYREPILGKSPLRIHSQTLARSLLIRPDVIAFSFRFSSPSFTLVALTFQACPISKLEVCNIILLSRSFPMLLFRENHWCDIAGVLSNYTYLLMYLMTLQ